MQIGGNVVVIQIHRRAHPVACRVADALPAAGRPPHTQPVQKRVAVLGGGQDTRLAPGGHGQLKIIHGCAAGHNHIGPKGHRRLDDLRPAAHYAERLFPRAFYTPPKLVNVPVAQHHRADRLPGERFARQDGQAQLSYQCRQREVPRRGRAARANSHAPPWPGDNEPFGFCLLYGFVRRSLADGHHPCKLPDRYPLPGFQRFDVLQNRVLLIGHMLTSIVI